MNSPRFARVFVGTLFCGVLEDTDSAYLFTYDEAYLNHAEAKAVSLTLPLREAPYESKTLFSFFDGLIPEGWLLEQAVKHLNLKPMDRFGLLLRLCQNTVGDVRVVAGEKI